MSSTLSYTGLTTHAQPHTRVLMLTPNNRPPVNAMNGE